MSSEENSQVKVALGSLGGESKLDISTSTVGVKHDNGKPDMSLIPPLAALTEAAVWTFGKRKYAAYNWAKGFDYSRVLAAMDRHMTLFRAGENLDEESGLPHLAHIRCCAAMLIDFCSSGAGKDDRRILEGASLQAVKAVYNGQAVPSAPLSKKTDSGNLNKDSMQDKAILIPSGTDYSAPLKTEWVEKTLEKRAESAEAIWEKLRAYNYGV